MTIIKNTSFKALLVASIIGVAVGGGVTLSLFNNDNDSANINVNKATKEKSNEPLYWVAPMDANYQRDKPGKSPMGMALVPVYADDGKGPDEGAGTIRISSNVINNLGVRTVAAQYQPLHTQINTVGYIVYDEDKLVHIHPRVQGWIEKLYVKSIGDPVKKGQALYDIYSPELVNAQEELLLALERKNQRLINAAENRLVALQLPKSAIKTLMKTRQVKQNITFYAPQNGVVENLKIREGFFVKPGSTLMAIGDLSEVWVEAEVFERQAALVRTGTPVTMTLDYIPGKRWQGKIDFIYPTLDAKTRTVKVRLRFKNENSEFKPNMFAQIAIHTSADESALLIPKEALIRTGTQDRVVLALGQGSFKSIEVGVGRFDSDNVEILSGLSAGELVVSSAQFLLDSESSKTSDFQRMNGSDDMAGMDHANMDHSGMEHSNMNMSDDMDESESSAVSASVTGSVNSVMVNHRMVNISRGPIEKWEREAAEVDFIVAENVDMSLFTQAAKLNFTFEIRDGEFLIVEATPVKAMTSEAMKAGEQ